MDCLLCLTSGQHQDGFSSPSSSARGFSQSVSLHHGRSLSSCHSLVSLSSQVRAIPGDIGFSVEELEDLYMVFKVTAKSKGSTGPLLSPMHPHAAARLHVVGGSHWSLGRT